MPAKRQTIRRWRLPDDWCHLLNCIENAISVGHHFATSKGHGYGAVLIGLISRRTQNMRTTSPVICVSSSLSIVVILHLRSSTKCYESYGDGRRLISLLHESVTRQRNAQSIETWQMCPLETKFRGGNN